MVRPEGLEPPAYRFEACRSIQLSYGRTFVILEQPRRSRHPWRVPYGTVMTFDVVALFEPSAVFAATKATTV
jgi:hypothetical protein